MRAIIEFENVPDGMSPYEMKYAVHFAVYEYWMRRSPPEEYVAKRYAHMSQRFRDDKLPRVRRAVTLMNSARVEVEETLELDEAQKDQIERILFEFNLDQAEWASIRPAVREKIRLAMYAENED